MAIGTEDMGFAGERKKKLLYCDKIAFIFTFCNDGRFKYAFSELKSFQFLPFMITFFNLILLSSIGRGYSFWIFQYIEAPSSHA